MTKRKSQKFEYQVTEDQVEQVSMWPQDFVVQKQGLNHAGVLVKIGDTISIGGQNKADWLKERGFI